MKPRIVLHPNLSHVRMYAQKTMKKSTLLVFPPLVKSKSPKDPSTLGKSLLEELKATDGSSIENKVAFDRLKETLKEKEINAAELSRFSNIGVKPTVVEQLKQHFSATNPTHSQAALVPAILTHKSIMIKDQTGTGKTLGLLMGILSKKSVINYVNMKESNYGPVVLFMVPSNALVYQTYSWAVRLAATGALKKTNELLQCVSGIGTSNGENTIEEELLKNVKPAILIGTPSRILELADKKLIDLTSVETIVMDEIDKLIAFEKSNETVKQKFKKIVHKRPAETLMEHIANAEAGTEPKDTKIHDKKPKKYVKNHAVDEEYTPFVPENPFESIQVIASSATLNSAMRKNLEHNRKWIHDPIVLDICGNQQSPETMTHHCVVIDDNGSVRDLQLKTERKPLEELKNKSRKLSKKISLSAIHNQIYNQAVDAASKLCHSLHVNRGIVFANSSLSMSRIAEGFCDAGIPAKKLWLDRKMIEDTEYEPVPRLSQDSFERINESIVRDITSSAYENGKIKLLCVDEMSSRGIDLESCDFVFILGLPQSYASYFHMSGRTARFGREGKVITILPSPLNEVKMQNMYKTMQLKPVPLFMNRTDSEEHY